MTEEKKTTISGIFAISLVLIMMISMLIGIVLSLIYKG